MTPSHEESLIGEMSSFWETESRNAGERFYDFHELFDFSSLFPLSDPPSKIH